MISRAELLEAIDACEREPITFQSCEKLATLYTVYDHLYRETETPTKTTAENIIGKWGDSEFLSVVEGKDSETVWRLMDELVSSVQLVMPRLYDALLSKLQN